MIYNDYINVLHIDLRNRRIEIQKRKDLVQYLGGVGIASKLLEENMQPGLPPLDGNQPIVLAIGAISTIYPAITKTVAMFISPLTGELGESYAGGRLAMAMFMLGYDAIIIKGKAEKPVYLSITYNNIDFCDASYLWGLDCDETGRIIREKEKGAGKRSILRIGAAGENGVKYASVCVDTYRHFGRLGLGAVFGSKNLKAVSILGNGNIPIKDFGNYFKTYKSIYERATSTELMSKYHDVGTGIGLETLNKIGSLPIRNLEASSDERFESITGESFAEENLVRKMACVGCPVGCIHIGLFRREFDKGYEYESVSVSYDYELMFSLGSYLDITDTSEILELIEAVERYGMDAISTGVSLGWATEAYVKELITEKDVLVPLKYGNKANYLQAIKYIAEVKNDFYKLLGSGTKAVSSVYGGKDFAMHYSGNEMAGYHTGFGSALGSTVGARHSHLCNGAYSMDQSIKLKPEEYVDKILNEEMERCVLNSLIICLFARKVYDTETVLSALHSAGYTDYDDEKLKILGEDIYRTKLRIKKKLGYNLMDVKLAKRFFETPAMGQKIDEEIFYTLLGDYNEKIEALVKD